MKTFFKQLFCRHEFKGSMKVLPNIPAGESWYYHIEICSKCKKEKVVNDF